MTRDQLGTLAVLLDGISMYGHRPIATVRQMVKEGYIGKQELLEAAEALAKETGTDPFVEASDLGSDGAEEPHGDDGSES